MEINNDLERVIRDRVIKLLRLAKENSSEYESVLAAGKAQELITKYSLEIDREILGLQEDRVLGMKIVSLKKWKSWQIDLSGMIASNFRCTCSFSLKAKSIQFYGEVKDLIVVSEVFKFLFEFADGKATKIIRQKRKTGESTKNIYKSYICGYLIGLNKHLSEQTRSLAIVVPSDVYVLRDSMTKTSSKKGILEKDGLVDKETFDAGVTDGRKVLGRKNIE